MTYCTYLTVYTGNKLPPFYIGSTSVKKIENGYRGSVASKKFKNIWNEELKNNPHLFKTIILTTHPTRGAATERENNIQFKLRVVRNSLYINESYASYGGFIDREEQHLRCWWNNGLIESHCPDRPGTEWVQGRGGWWTNGEESVFALQSPGIPWRKGRTKSKKIKS